MILQRKFNNVEIDFSAFMQKKEVMVNATQMGNAFEKKVAFFLRNKQIQEFIDVLEKEFGNKNYCEIVMYENEQQVANLQLDQVVNEKKTVSENILKVVHGGRENGTWMHRYLSIAFAMWLSPYFLLWVTQIIEEILFGFAREQDASFEHTVELQAQLKELENKENKGEDLAKYIEIQEELNNEKNNRTKKTVSRIKDIQTNLFNQSNNEKQ